MTMTWQDWKDEGRLWGAVALQQLTGWKESTCYTLVGLKSRWHWIQGGRRYLTWALKKKILEKYDWTCLYPGCGIRNPWGKVPNLAKIEVDHCVSLFHFGAYNESNLQALCAPHNKAKGIRDADYRK